MPGARYSPAFKRKMVEKLLRPDGPSAWALSRESGVTYTTLSRWASKARSLAGVTKEDQKPKKRWTPEEKLRIVVQASELSDKELGAFLRREGVHTEQLELWHETVRGAFGEQSPKARRRAQADRKRIRELERELARKEKALAEAAAPMWLKKKAQSIWGDEDDDTPRRNGE